MTERIKKLTELTLSGQMYVDTVNTTFNEADLLLPRQQMESKRICEYILNQEPKLTEYSCMTGFFNFDGSVVGDAFRRGGHKTTKETMKFLYRKIIDNLSIMEWQHATADYDKILKKGIRGIIEEIEESLKNHNEPEQVEFLLALKRVANALIAWAHKCSKRALAFSLTVQNEEYRNNLKKLSEALLRVSENAPETFYEAVLSIYLCFSADPDSVGTLDRYLHPNKNYLCKLHARRRIAFLYRRISTKRRGRFYRAFASDRRKYDRIAHLYSAGVLALDKKDSSRGVPLYA